MLKFTLKEGLVFGLGVLIQALNMIGISSNTRKKAFDLLFCIGISAMAFLPSRKEMIYDLRNHLPAFFLLFSVFLALFFAKEILPKISEKVILIFTLIFWYAWVNELGFQLITNANLFRIAFIPTVLVFFVVFTPYKIPFTLKVILYIWFLIIVSSMGIHLYSDIIQSIFLRHPLPAFSLFDLFLLGGSSLYLMTNLTYLYYLIPIPGKRQSFSDRIREWKKFINLLANKYDNKQLEIRHSLLWTISLISLFAINSHYLFLNHSTMVTLSIFILSYSEFMSDFIIKHGRQQKVH